MYVVSNPALIVQPRMTKQAPLLLMWRNQLTVRPQCHFSSVSFSVYMKLSALGTFRMSLIHVRKLTLNPLWRLEAICYIANSHDRFFFCGMHLQHCREIYQAAAAADVLIGDSQPRMDDCEARTCT